MSPRTIRRATYALLHFGLAASAIISGGIISAIAVEIDPDAAVMPVFTRGLGLLWLFVGYYPSRWLSNALAPLVVTSLLCPRCGYKTDPVDIWSGGSYTDHAERHVYSFRDPDTGIGIGRISCPQCDSTILL